MKTAVSSIYGRIQRILLTCPNYNKDNVIQIYQGIFDALGENRQYIIFAENDAQEEIAQMAASMGISPDERLTQVHAFPSPFVQVFKLEEKVLYEGMDAYRAIVDSPFHTQWAQDGYFILNTEDGRTVMMESIHFARRGDHFIAEQLAANTDIEVEPSKYWFMGGDILVGDDYALIGRDTLDDNLRLTNENEEQITNGFKSLLKVRHILWIGNKSPINFTIDIPSEILGRYQPIHHIDMFLTLAGKSEDGRELVFVGDAEMASGRCQESCRLNRFHAACLTEPMMSEAILSGLRKTTEIGSQFLTFPVHRVGWRLRAAS